MIGIDTNVLIRLLVGDDADQQELVKDFFARRDGSDPAFVSAIALLETLWVLRRRFGYSSPAVLDALRKMLSSAAFNIQFGERLSGILESGDPSSSDIADHLIAWSGEVAGCSHTVTFDRRAAKSVQGMEHVA